jgi:hypothetical protein
MFPWLLPGASPPSQLSLLSMLPGAGAPQQSGFFSRQSLRDPQTYWAQVNAQRKPGQSNWDSFVRGMLPQEMWPPAWRDNDRSDQTRQGNQPDTGNAMAPSGGAGGPDNTPMSGYDPNTVAGYDPGWMRMFGGGWRRPNMMNMGALGLSMLQPRYPQRAPGPYPWF